MFLNLNIIIRRLHLWLIRRLGPDASILMGWVYMPFWLIYLGLPVISCIGIMIWAHAMIPIYGEHFFHFMKLPSSLILVIGSAWPINLLYSDMVGFWARTPAKWLERIAELETRLKNLEKRRA